MKFDAGPLIGRTLANAHKTGARFDLQLALLQHGEMVSIYEENGAKCHYLAATEMPHRNFFARDSSAMTPWGALICHMQLKCRRADHVTAIEFYQSQGISIWKYATAGHFEGGDCNIIEPGRVLIGYCGERFEKEGAEQIGAFVRGWGIEIIDVEDREAKNLGVNLVALGNGKVLSMRGATDLNARMRALGFDVYDPDMSMFTLGGGGVHCLCQALNREES